MQASSCPMRKWSIDLCLPCIIKLWCFQYLKNPGKSGGVFAARPSYGAVLWKFQFYSVVFITDNLHFAHFKCFFSLGGDYNKKDEATSRKGIKSSCDSDNSWFSFTIFWLPMITGNMNITYDDSCSVILLRQIYFLYNFIYNKRIDRALQSKPLQNTT